MTASSTGPVREQDKARAHDYFEGLSSGYDESVSRGPLKWLRDKERGAMLAAADIGPGAPRTVIDVGCGGGHFARAARANGHTVTAVDISAGMVAAVKDHVNEAFVADLESMDLGGRTFDRVLCMGALDFVMQPVRAFESLCRLVAPGGRLALQVPRRNVGGHVYALEKKLRGIRVNLFEPAWFQREAQRLGFTIATRAFPLPHNMVLTFSHHTTTQP